GAREAGRVRLRPRRQGAGAADGAGDPRPRRAADAEPRRRRARGRDLPRARTAASASGGLGVLPREGVGTAGRWAAAEGAVWSALVVVVEPVWQGGGAVLAGAVDAAEAPFALERLLVALHLAVCLWSSRPDEAVLDAMSLEKQAQRAVVPIDEGVVGEQT